MHIGITNGKRVFVDCAWWDKNWWHGLTTPLNRTSSRVTFRSQCVNSYHDFGDAGERDDDDYHWSCLCFWENCLTFRKSKVSCKCKHNVTGDTFDSSRATPLTSTRYKTLAELLPTSKSNLLEMSIGVLPWDTGDHLNPWEKGKSSTLLICISTFVNIR